MSQANQTLKKRGSQSSGFTLIELMIAVAILGILAAIVYPSYKGYVEKTRRADAQADLLELAQFMERRYSNNFDYSDGGNNPTLPFDQSPRNADTPAYNIAFVSGSVTRNSFELQATAQAIQSDDECGNMSIDEAGNLTPDKAGCW